LALLSSVIGGGSSCMHWQTQMSGVVWGTAAAVGGVEGVDAVAGVGGGVELMAGRCVACGLEEGRVMGGVGTGARATTTVYAEAEGLTLRGLYAASGGLDHRHDYWQEGPLIYVFGGL